MKPVNDWQKSWRWFSVQAMTLATAIQGAWMTLPANLLSHVSDNTKNAVVIGLLVGGIIGRLVDQPKTRT